ncbi:FAD-dependent oxidoreductase [Alcaligenaceae bacterium]|nr:FAD-dependent oxidoreductase [Alcaligenaceae bacterium]
MIEEHADVIVLGGGGSGLAAASEAAKAGAKVILLEKNAKLGGSTAWAVGSVSATGTSHQRRVGITDDTPDAHFEDLGKFAGEMECFDNLALRRILVDNAPAMFDWLQSNGLVFMGPALELPHRHPRMHNVVPGSRAYPYHLGRLCRRLGVDIRTSTRAVAFCMENRRVAGVETIDPDGETRYFRARRAVVLTSGDFSGGHDLKRRYVSEIVSRTDPVNVTATGDGHDMALAIGATVLNGNLAHGPLMRFIPPTSPSWITRVPPYTIVARLATFAMRHLPQAVIRPILMSFVTTALSPDPGLFGAGAVLVNARGERFTNELDKPAAALVTQPEGRGYIVLDGTLAKRFTAWPNFISTAPNVAHAYLADYRRNRRDVYHEANSLPAMAKQLGMDASMLVTALTAGDRAGRRPTPPFVVLGPVKSYVVMTEGGLKVDDRHAVIGEDGNPIAGLFAAGSAGQGGLLLYGHGHHLGWAFVSGLRAGRHAAEYPAATSS